MQRKGRVALVVVPPTLGPRPQVEPHCTKSHLVYGSGYTHWVVWIKKSSPGVCKSLKSGCQIRCLVSSHRGLNYEDLFQIAFKLDVTVTN
ncbi:hypothetical protein AVEN_235387-1 [Araneus ventricosus]|uniref:Uncharacterized protein n=1 Tax=Araneus ventricosus TaxID=182803 RepID=A0A4Y2A685_ARAVE|nr:hypothetical protein AVEN_235387-1 [Araneus ventricosus]